MGAGNNQKVEKEVRIGNNQKAEKKELVCYIDQIPKDAWVLILSNLVNDTLAFSRLSMTCTYFNLLKREEALKDSLIYYASVSKLGKEFMLSLHKFCREMKDGGILVPCSVDSNTAKSPIDILVIDLNDLKIPEGVDPKKIQHLAINSIQPWGLGTKDSIGYTNELKAFFSSNQFSDLKSAMLYSLEKFGTEVLNFLPQSKMERLYLDQFNLNGQFFKYNGFKSLRILRVINPKIMTMLPPLSQLTDLQIRISSTTQVNSNCILEGECALRIQIDWSSLKNFEFTCHPNCKDQKIYFELVIPTHLKKLIFKARPHQGKLVLMGLPSELKDISAYEDSDIVIWNGVKHHYPSIRAFQEKYGQNIKFNIEK